MSKQKLASLKASKRYAGREISPLAIKKVNCVFVPPTIDGQLFKLSTGEHQERFFAQKMHMRDINWQVHIWSSLAGINKQKSFLTVLSISGYLLILFLVLFTKERLRNARHMREARALLENRVRARTQDLTATNNRLVAEIQQRKHTEQQLKNTQDELIQSAKLAVIGNMSASINHEINQPLTALKSYCQNAITFQQRGMDNKVFDNLNLMNTLTDRIAEIIAQFKNFSKKSTGTQSAILIQESIEAALSIINHQAQKSGVDIQVNMDKPQLYCLGDEIRLEQVFVNLLNNAIQAMTDSQSKVIEVEVHQVTTVSENLDKPHHQISIRDHGPGILEGNIDKIFEPFFTTKESYGLGLGLSISQRIIESMQGILKVQNHPKGGAEFIILLPQHVLTKSNKNE